MGLFLTPDFYLIIFLFSNVLYFQLASIALYSGPMLTVMGVRGVTACSLVSWKYYFTVIFPLALAKFMSSAMSHVSISKVPVSYAHTVKATMPLFTVAISRVLFSEKHSWSVYLSLVPIVAGVAVATVTEVSNKSSMKIFEKFLVSTL